MKNLLLWCLLLLLSAMANADIRFERFIPSNPTSDFAPTIQFWFSGQGGTSTCDIVGTPVLLVADALLLTVLAGAATDGRRRFG